MNCDISYGTASFKGLEFEILPVENTLGNRVNHTCLPIYRRALQ